ncbi:MAG TPA: DUF1493 family protein [Pontibacter sp.]
MEEVEVQFSDLRRTAESVINFIETEYWWDNDFDFNSEIEFDLGITGDDAEELVAKFAEKYNVDLKEFEFNKYFSPEGFSGNPLLLPILLLVWVIFFIEILLSLITYPLHKVFKKKVFEFNFTKRLNNLMKRIWPNKLESLTVRDLITAVLVGRFVEINSVCIKLKKAEA